MSQKKKMVLSSLICLLPMFVGLAAWQLLPQQMVRHIGPFGADGFSPKFVVVLLIPLMFLALHWIVSLKPEWLNLKKKHLNTLYMPIASVIFFAVSVLLSR